MRVLVAQHDRVLAARLRRGLAEHGAAVDIAHNTASVVANARAHAYDVIVLDQELQEVPGAPMCPRLRAAVNGTPVLMLVGSTADRPVRAGSGVQEHLRKPVDVPELVTRVRAMARRHENASAPLRRAPGHAPAPQETPAPPTTAVLIADNLAMYAQALTAVLSTEPDLRVISTDVTETEILAAVRRGAVEVLVVDIDGGALDAVALCRRLRQEAAGCKVIVLTANLMPAATCRTWEAQAHGLVNKNSQLPVLIEAIRRVARGERVVDPKLASAAREADNGGLTRRELEVLRHAAAGESVREIAARLSLSSGTVRNYLSRIMDKLGARNRIDAIRIVRDSGLL
jgi:two-component system response regulator DesR